MFPSGWKRDPGYLDGFLPNGQCFINVQCFIAEDDGDAAAKISYGRRPKRRWT